MNELRSGRICLTRLPTRRRGPFLFEIPGFPEINIEPAHGDGIPLTNLVLDISAVNSGLLLAGPGGRLPN